MTPKRFVKYVKKVYMICTDKKMLTSTKLPSFFTYNTGYICKLLTGFLPFTWLHPGATRTRDPEVYMQIIILIHEILFQNEISHLIHVFRP